MLRYILFLCDFASEKTIRQRNKIVIEMHFIQVTCEISKILSVREKTSSQEPLHQISDYFNDPNHPH